ncbi:transmembrane domain protein [Mycobacterium xenopi 4042]|uniref:Transmembrane domain protein n=1 Tax=Mycobacterium xenopi 4042 TaxID=1299334 RepID=X8BKG7_MYCXE|nr:transmembrane domain protein [Mycobacterium xenopi 4042]
MAGAVSLLLASPIDVQSSVHNPLPDGTGNGLSAFYYALLLLLGASPAVSWSVPWSIRCLVTFQRNSARCTGSPSRSTSRGFAPFW